MHSAHSSASSPRRTTTVDPDITTTTTNNNAYYNSYYSSYNANPYDEPSFHARSRSSAQVAFPQSPKRRSVFSARSRSNTTNSTANSTNSSSRRSPASSLTSADAASSLPSLAQDPSVMSASGPYPHPPPRTERQDSITKSLLYRGSRILRRQGSKFSISATLDEVDEGEREREKPRFDVTDLFGRHRSRQSETSDQLKRLISDPYDFHHLTHTGPSHLQSLQQARENDLVTEFSAIRASQKPVTSLKGIRADDLHFRDFSSNDLTTPTPTGVATSGDDEYAFAIPPAASPPASPGASSSVSPRQQVARPERESRVCENFSRPVSRYPRTGSGSSIVSSPPQRPTPQLADAPELESAPRAISHVLGQQPQPQPQQQQRQWQRQHEPASSRKVSLSQVNLAALFESENQGYGADVDPRASTTNLLLDLEDVPEEEEEKEAGVTHWHDSPEQPADGRLSPAPAGMAQSSCLPTPKPHPSVYVAEELSKKFSEALTSPTLPQYRLYQQQIPKQDVPTSVDGTIHESWDADIDYCYEHAAESTSNFDWSRRSFDEAQHPATIEENSEQDSWQEQQRQKKHQSSMHLSTSSLSCPDLDPSPSRSVPSTQLAVTPSTTAYEGDYFQVPGSMFSAPGGKPMTQESLYDDYAEPDRHHLSICSQGVIQAPMDHHHSLSPRSSFSPVSNCNSQESLIISRAGSIVRKHRSSLSATSIPELVNSLASSRETMPAESLPSHHRQTKSLEAGQILFGGAADNTASLDSAEILPMHDRAKSTSDVAVAPPPPAGARRKTSRTASYSLFPVN